jgi:hypothetical protein
MERLHRRIRGITGGKDPVRRTAASCDNEKT